MSIALNQTNCKNRSACIGRTLAVGRHFGFTYLTHALDGMPRTKVQAHAIETFFPHETLLRAPAQKIAERSNHLKQTHLLGYDVHSYSVGYGKNKSKETAVSFHMAGTRKPVAEATVIHLAYTTLRALGIPNTTVHINALGNNESNIRYNRELSTYLKKVLPVTPQLLTEINERPRFVYSRLIDECAPYTESAPSPIDYLNDEARSHLKSLLEYLEAADIPYVIDPTVVGSSDVWEYILFDIRENSDQENRLVEKGSEKVCITPRILAHGGRYTTCIRKAYKQLTDSVSVVISIEGDGPVSKKEIETSLPSSSFFFGHVSESAKKISLKVLGLLYDAGMYVRHAVTRDTLTHQLQHADAPAYMIMIGHKEALAGTAIVRNEKTRTQKEIPIHDLASYLKKLVVVTKK
jgi:histidyl-tRNA synthetase